MIEVTIGEPVSREVTVRRELIAMVVDQANSAMCIKYMEKRFIGESEDPKGMQEYDILMKMEDFTQESIFNNLSVYISGKISSEPSHI